MTHKKLKLPLHPKMVIIKNNSVFNHTNQAKYFMASKNVAISMANQGNIQKISRELKQAKQKRNPIRGLSPRGKDRRSRIKV